MPTTKAKKANPKAANKPAPKKPATAKASAPKPAAKKKLSALDAAAQVLTENGGAMNTKELIEAMAAQKLWQSPNGKTPAATLYAAILREITTKGTDSRFKKTEPGKFAATGNTGKPEATPTTEKPKGTAKATKGKTAKGKKGAKKKPAEAPTIPDGTPGPESMQELFRL
jgi:vancomycin resistance protein YoaR